MINWPLAMFSQESAAIASYEVVRSRFSESHSQVATS